MFWQNYTASYVGVIYYEVFCIGNYVRRCFSDYMAVKFKIKKTSASQLELSQIPSKNILFSKTKSLFQTLTLSR